MKAWHPQQGEMAMRLPVRNKALNENGTRSRSCNGPGAACTVVYAPANQSTFGPDRQQRHSDINGNLWDSTGHISNLPIFGSTTGYSESMDHGPLVQKLLTMHANYLSKESLVLAYNPWHELCQPAASCHEDRYPIVSWKPFQSIYHRGPLLLPSFAILQFQWTSNANRDKMRSFW